MRCVSLIYIIYIDILKNKYQNSSENVFNLNVKNNLNINLNNNDG